jgi:hypothetical protein
MDLTGFDWKWVLTALIAAYGAALSSFNAIVAHRMNRRRMSVSLSYDLRLVDGDKLATVIVLKARNLGNRPVMLERVGFQLRDGTPPFCNDVLKFWGVDFPHELKEGTRCEHLTNIFDLDHLLRQAGCTGKVRMRGFYDDAVDGEHFSQLVSFDVDLVFEQEKKDVTTVMRKQGHSAQEIERVIQALERKEEPTYPIVLRKL